MKRSRKVNGAILFIGIILILSLFFVTQTRPFGQVGESTVGPVTPSLLDLRITATYIALLPKFPTIANPPSTPIPPTTIKSPTATSTLAPPACTFPLAGTTSEESTPQNYTFSEPQVVLTVPQGNIYNVTEWLPDNQQVLITEELRNVELGNDKPIQESISLYSPEADETEVIALRHLTYESPFWLPDLNAVVYPAVTYTSIDRNNGTFKFTRQILVSYGDPDTAQVLADNLSQILLAVKPGGSEVVYLSDNKLSKLDRSLKDILPISIDFDKWDYAKERRDERAVSYKMAWQPGTSLIFLYSGAGGSKGGGYTFILNTDTGKICELNMGGWATRARWSSNGRYLAITRSEVYAGFSDLTDLVVLDAITGNLYTVEVVSHDVEGKHYVSDFTWAPDNLHLLILEDVPLTYDPNRIETIHHQLYLIDFISDENVQVLPEFKSFVASGAPRNNFAWSPDGSKLLIRCPANGVDRMCFMSVQRTGQ